MEMATPWLPLGWLLLGRLLLGRLLTLSKSKIYIIAKVP